MKIRKIFKKKKKNSKNKNNKYNKKKMKFLILAFFLVSISCSDLFLPNTIPENFTSCQKDGIIDIN